jgi:L-ascorbate metabolism protein UlaG (beta-lactamase superfamily)
MVKLLFHGHACWEIDDGEHRVLIDPFLTGNDLAQAGPDDFDKLDAILVTHGHADHTGDSEAIAKKTGALIISNFEIASYFEAKGCNVHPMHIGGGREFGSAGAVRAGRAGGGRGGTGSDSGATVPVGRGVDRGVGGDLSGAVQRAP